MFLEVEGEAQSTQKMEEYFPHFCRLSSIQLHIQFQLGMYTLLEKCAKIYSDRIKRIVELKAFQSQQSYICISRYYYCLALVKLSKHALAEQTLEEFREFLSSNPQLQESYEFLYLDLKGEMLVA
mmetsp:Transcript_23600/g.23276  ORF Transcript_23600/g.23276 Transcript_23600/m.23276 type:complete len:125 (-) Transcript_23600:1179-1553(-)